MHLLVAGVFLLIWLRALYFVLRFFSLVLNLRTHLKQHYFDEYRRIFGDWFPIYSPVMGLRLWGFIISNTVEADSQTQMIRQLIRKSIFQFGLSIGAFIGLGLIMTIFFS